MKSRQTPSVTDKYMCQLLYQAEVYQIEVIGHLSTQKVNWFEGLTLTHRYDDSGMPVTRITGEIQDQAALHGLLNKIRDLGLSLLSVNCVR